MQDFLPSQCSKGVLLETGIRIGTLTSLSSWLQHPQVVICNMYTCIHLVLYCYVVVLGRHLKAIVVSHLVAFFVGVRLIS